MILNNLIRIARFLLNKILQFFNLVLIFRIGDAIGDQVCLTSIVRYMHIHDSRKILIVTNFPEIFVNNKRIKKVIKINQKYSVLVNKILRNLSGSSIKNFLFDNGSSRLSDYMRGNKNSLHLSKLNSMHFLDMDKNIDISNEFFFSEREMSEFQKKFSFNKNFSIISPVSKSSYTINKQWDFSHFQQVVNLKKDVLWVQTGLSDDRLLSGVIDLRGKTSIRELIYIVSKANFILSTEGVLNHIASAFETTSYVIISGFSDKSIAAYHNTHFFESKFDCPDSPCWRLNDCLFPNRPCINQIKPKDIVNQI